MELGWNNYSLDFKLWMCKIDSHRTFCLIKAAGPNIGKKSVLLLFVFWGVFLFPIYARVWNGKNDTHLSDIV